MSSGVANPITCPVANCGKKVSNLQAFWGHLTFKHHMPTEEINEMLQKWGAPPREATNPGAASPVAAAPTPTAATPAPRVARESGATEVVDAAKKSELRGQLRFLLGEYNKLPLARRDMMMPQREVIVDFMRELTKVDIDPSKMSEIEARTVGIKAELERAARGDESVGEGAGPPAQQVPITAQDISHRQTVERIRGLVRALIKKTAKLPANKRDEMLDQVAALSLISRRISQLGVRDSELAELESQVTTEIKPFIDAAVPEPVVGGAVDLENEDELDELEKEDMSDLKKDLRRQKLQTRRLEARLEGKQYLEALKASGQTQGRPPDAMVQRYVPMIGADGKPVLDANGNPVFQVITGPPTVVDPMTMMLVGQSQKGGGLAEAVELVKALQPKTDPNSGGNALAEVFKAQAEMFRQQAAGMDKKLDQTQAQNNEQIRAMYQQIQAAQSQAQQTLNALQEERLKRAEDMTNQWRLMAQQDPMKKLKEAKADLKELGVIPDAHKTAEEKAVEESAGLLRQTVEKADTAADKVDKFIEKVAVPFVQTQNKLMEQQMLGRRPLQQATRSEEEKVREYKRLVDELEKS